MKVVWTTPASRDLSNILAYIAQDNLTAAEQLGATVLGSVARLSDSPMLGRAGRVDGTRELVVHRHYVVIYRILDDRVSILAFLHTARRYPPDNR